MLLLVVYFGRLIVLNPKRPYIKWVAVVSGLVVNPAFYLAYACAPRVGDRGPGRNGVRRAGTRGGTVRRR